MAKKLINGKPKAKLTKQLIFENVSVELITKSVGTSKESFYTYFSTIRGIIVRQSMTIDVYYRSTEAIVL
jgi:AcrR family transcriptional regulator